MRHNFTGVIVPKKNRVYFVSYLDEERNYYEFYCLINSVINDYFYFTITSFLKGNEDKKYEEEVQLCWTQTQFNAAYVNLMEEFELKEASRCKLCGRALYFIRTAFCCKVHHVVGGF